jgi:hypothetical protein
MTRSSYGDELGEIAAALARVYATTRPPHTGVGPDAYAVALNRAQLYQALYRQTVLIGGSDDHPLAGLLRGATLQTAAAQARLSALPETPPATAPAAVALCHAADVARIAGDILATHLAPGNTARTPDGVAILAGVHRAENLSLLATLARAVVRVDQHLAAWLRPHPAGDARAAVVRRRPEHQTASATAAGARRSHRRRWPGPPGIPGHPHPGP